MEKKKKFGPSIDPVISLMESTLGTDLGILHDQGTIERRET